MIDCNVLQLRGTPGGFVGTEFGCRLFGHLYEVAVAYVIQNVDGEGELCLFDTTFARDVLKRSWPDGAELALYNDHPEGNLSPMEDDLENLLLMPAGTRLFIVCEDSRVELRESQRWSG